MVQSPLVLPATVCTGPSWAQTRSLIERDFILDMVIASHDPLRWNFSDSTDLSEALLIATRRPDNRDSDEHRTIFVNLWRNPDGVLDAHRVAQAIAIKTPAELENATTSLLEVDGEHVGEVLSIPEFKLVGKQWSGMQFARADLIRSASKILDDGEAWVPGQGRSVSIPLCPLAGLGTVSPDIRDIWDGFERTEAVTAYPMVENHNTDQRRWIATKPDKYLAPLVEPRPGRHLKTVDQLWPKAGRLLVGARSWLNTVRVVAMQAEESVPASMWWPVRIEDPMLERALTVWLNSSFGLLTLLAVRNTTRGPWVQLKKADLNEVPVLDVRRLSSVQLQELSGLFDQLAGVEFERMPGMAICQARRALASEPVVLLEASARTR